MPLTLSKEHLFAILNALPMPVSWASLDDERIKFMNDAFTKTFGYKASEFDTITDWIVRAYPRPEDREISKEKWGNVWTNSNNGVSDIDQTEVDILCADGSVKTAQIRGILLHDLNIAIALFEDISEQRSTETLLRRVALEDPLTGLPNRRALEQHWARIAANPDPGLTAMLLIDLDGFKAINDTLGHDAGDETLKIVAKRLTDSVRSGDLVCRMGGDEFVVLLSGLKIPDQVEQVCWRIQTELTRPMNLMSRPATVGASIGASLAPQDGKDLRSLLKCADEALYRRKVDRKGGWEWFKKPMAA